MYESQPMFVVENCDVLISVEKNKLKVDRFLLRDRFYRTVEVR